ncbi:mechanosensitive ion channel family protein [Microlunatus speluncae]|uniref:mechanosensitive ion channel family protein n=1 Tax=Microlunatus speluncae TaxID=2594267 RepID=UPI001266248A|nr:hypothetical protein [Microlunatus speluncae]
MGEVLVRALSDGLSAVVTFVPKLLGFLIILLIGWLIAKGLSKLVEILLAKIGFGNLLERAGLKKFVAQVNIDVSGLIVKIVYYFVLLIALQFAFSAFGPNPVEQLLSTIITFLPRVIVAIILVVIAAAVAKVLKDLLLSVLAGRSFARLLSNLVYGLVIALGVIAAVNQLGVATTVTTPVLVTVLGTIGGVIIVGVGGGLIRPMQQRWEGWLESLAEQVSTDAPAPAHAASAQPAHAAPEQDPYAVPGDLPPARPADQGGDPGLGGPPPQQ